MMSTFSRIFGSRKAVFTLIAFGCTIAMAWTGRVTGTEALGFMKWILGAWLFAQTAEDVTMHIKGTHPGNQPKAAPVVPAAASSGSLPPAAPSVPPGASEAPPAA
jgi:hypothetical protein